ncbi:uncharacterized protein LOC112521004 [Cynara cardunculus var. scolymus]|uniref:uncharacterized protein LOC112521004 n=1 Tax=Cynara cardunculus var. scolymus TaxID=59895 RepID=UPI000D62B829|nr:uncharacterized protein LOC112521004 [Cynara cardunculus var. scolymus]
MLKTSLLQNAVRISSSRLMRKVHPHKGIRSVLSSSPTLRQLSTESASPTNQFSSTKPLFETPSSGLVYGRLVGITKNTLKSDILSLLEECNLSADDLKVDYNPFYLPTGMIVQFASRSAYDAAARVVNRKGRLYKLDRANRANWDYVQPYGGKFVLLQGIPPNATIEDIERFLAVCDYDSSNIRLFFRQGASGSIPTAAMSAMITKNRGFCYNNM